MRTNHMDREIDIFMTITHGEISHMNDGIISINFDPLDGEIRDRADACTETVSVSTSHDYTSYDYYEMSGDDLKDLLVCCRVLNGLIEERVTKCRAELARLMNDSEVE